MRRGELAQFSDFLIDEAKKYGRSIQVAEVETWFETFRRASLEAFKEGWIRHKRDEFKGHQFPTIPIMQRHLSLERDEKSVRDWRCAEEIGGERCGFPGSISEGTGGEGKFYCSAHYRLKNSATYSTVTSLEIIHAGMGYTPPKSLDDLYSLSEKRRAAAMGERAQRITKQAPAPRASDDEVLEALRKHRVDAGLPVEFSPDAFDDDSHLFQEEAAQ